MVSSVGLYVLTLFTKSDAIVDGAVEDGKVSGEMLEQPRLFVGVLNLH